MKKLYDTMPMIWLIKFFSISKLLVYATNVRVGGKVEMNIQFRAMKLCFLTIPTHNMQHFNKQILLIMIIFFHAEILKYLLVSNIE